MDHFCRAIVRALDACAMLCLAAALFPLAADHRVEAGSIWCDASKCSTALVPGCAGTCTGYFCASTCKPDRLGTACDCL